MAAELERVNGNHEAAKAYETALIAGDLNKLTVDQRLAYYKSVCDSLKLNMLTRPFDYIVLNGKLTLYARKDCTEQLRKLNQVSIAIVAREVVEDCYIVTARATMPDGRQDESIGAVSIGGLKGEARANCCMKSETKAKRRVTLSICGLGMLDETEVETVPNAYHPDSSVEANSLPPEEQLKARQANPQPPRKAYCTQQQQDALRDISDELGLSNEDRVGILRRFSVKRVTYLTPEQCGEVTLELMRRAVGKMLTELALNLDDVRMEDSSIAADTPDELTADQAAAALKVLRDAKDRQEVPV